MTAETLKSLGFLSLSASVAALCGTMWVPAIALAGVAAVGLAIKGYLSTTIVTKSVSFVGTFPADRLITSYVLVPVQFLKATDTRSPGNPDNIYRDTDFSDLKKLPEGFIARGYCTAKYQVSIGYADVSKLVDNKGYVRAACAGKFDELPRPDIISKVPLEGPKAYMNFTMGDCRKLQEERSGDGRQYIEAYIEAALQRQFNNKNKIDENGKKTLASFLKINCDL